MTRLLSLTAAAAVAAASLALAGPASATAFCMVKRTSDGFAAVRSGPTTDAPILARLRAGDEVMLVLDPQGRWQRVRWWRGQERVNDSRSTPRGEGWMHLSLVEDCG